MKHMVTTRTKYGYGEVTGVPSTTTNTYSCCLKVCHRPANCNLEFDNMGSNILIGPAGDEWDMFTGNHSERICCNEDRLNCDENPHLVGIAPTKPEICLRKSIVVKLHTLRQLE